jgi:hypothetical protein
MKRKGPAPVPTTDLPPELAEFNWQDWTRDDDPPEWDPERFEVCAEHGRKGCAPCRTGPLMWTSDQRYSEMHRRYWLALEAWAFKHGMTVDEVHYVICGGDEASEALWTG